MGNVVGSQKCSVARVRVNLLDNIIRNPHLEVHSSARKLLHLRIQVVR